MQLPEIIETPEKLIAKYSLGLDKDGDGVKSVSAGAFIEIDKKEVLSEAAQELLKSDKVPEWLKNLVRGSV